MDDPRQYSLSHTLALSALIVLIAVLARGVIQDLLSQGSSLLIGRAGDADSPLAATMRRTASISGGVVFALFYFCLGYWLARRLYRIRVLPALLVALATGGALIAQDNGFRLPALDHASAWAPVLRDSSLVLLPLVAMPLGALRASWDVRQGTLLSFRASGASLMMLAGIGAAFLGLYRALV
jgi:hypothetical protein